MEYASIILKSNAVFTGIEDAPFRGGVAVRGNRIIAVEKGDAIDAYIGEDTVDIRIWRQLNYGRTCGRTRSSLVGSCGRQ